MSTFERRTATPKPTKAALMERIDNLETLLERAERDRDKMRAALKSSQDAFAAIQTETMFGTPVYTMSGEAYWAARAALGLK